MNKIDVDNVADIMMLIPILFLLKMAQPIIKSILMIYYTSKLMAILLKFI